MQEELEENAAAISSLEASVRDHTARLEELQELEECYYALEEAHKVTTAGLEDNATVLECEKARNETLPSRCIVMLFLSRNLAVV